MLKVLMFNIGGKKAVEIKMICHKMRIPVQEVENDLFNCAIESILGMSDSGKKRGEGSFDEEMLLFVNFNNVMLDIMLTQLRRKKCTVDLKAVLTDTNKSFTPIELCNELKAEREAIQKGRTAHT